MARYISNTSIKHGQGSGADRKTWNISKGQSFDPAEMGMADHAVDRMLKSNRIKLDTGSGPESMAKPIATPVSIDPRTGVPTAQVGPSEPRAPTTPDPKSSVGLQEAQSGSTHGGTPAGGSTQGGKASGGK